ncbi:MAG: purine-binding chemotaxis protein CheW [Deltaproteobacteria bacterium]|nr:purine-binding chemotaxis protein CheW [Deltaproteobacteria bacterium]
MQKKRALQGAAQTASSGADLQVICFKLGAESYGLDIMQIKEIIRCQKITSVPKAPYFIQGVINLRGMVIPIIDLRKRFELPADVNPKTRIIIAQVEKRIVGLVVGDVTDIISLPKANLMPPPKMVKGAGAEYLDGMADIKGELLFIVNLDKMLTAEEKSSLDAPL